MNSVLLALTWETLARTILTRLMLISASLLFMLVYASILSVQTTGFDGANDPTRLILEVSSLPAVLFLLFLSTGVGTWPTSRLYTKPLSNRFINAWQTWSGALTLAIVTPAIVTMYNCFCEAGWPTLNATLFSVLFWIVAQPFLLIGLRSFTYLFITSLPIAAVAAWYQSGYGMFDQQRHAWSRLSILEIMVMAIVAIVFPQVSRWAIAADRCGETRSFSWWHSVERAASWLFRESDVLLSRPKFRSGFTAHLWTQWRWKGYGLMLSMLLLWFVAIIATLVTQGPTWNIFISLAHLLPGLAASGFWIVCLVYGFVLGANVDRWVVGNSRQERTRQVSLGDAIGSFVGVLPISDRQIATVNLLVCGGAIALAAVVCMVPLAIALILGPLDQQLGIKIPIWQFVPLVIGIWWISAANTMTIVCTGHTVRALVSTIWCVVFPTVAILFSSLLIAHTTVVWLFGFYGVLLGAGIVALTIFCTFMAIRKRLVGAKTIVGVSTFLLAATLLGISLREAVPIAGIGCYALAVVLCILPIVSMPLAVHANRHR